MINRYRKRFDRNPNDYTRIKAQAGGGKRRIEKMTLINGIRLPWLQMCSWEDGERDPPLFLMQTAGRGSLPTKDADLMVAKRSQILQSRARLLWEEVGRSSGLASLCTASSLTQAWSCRGGGKGGERGGGRFPGPPCSLLLLLSLPCLPASSTHPALNASFPCVVPRYCLQLLARNEQGIAEW